MKTLFALTSLLCISVQSCLALGAADKNYLQSLPPMISGTNGLGLTPGFDEKNREVEGGSGSDSKLVSKHSTTLTGSAVAFDHVQKLPKITLQRAELMSTCNPALKGRSFYLLAVPMNIVGNMNRATLDVQLTVPDSLKEKLRIESIYPSHEYLSTQYQHTNEFGVEADGGFAPYGTAKVHDTDTRQSTYTFNSPVVYGIVDQDNWRVVWNYVKQGKQRIDQGTVTNFIVLSSKDALKDTDKVSVNGFEFANNKPIGWGSSVVSADATRTVDIYSVLHKAELPVPSVALLDNLGTQAAPATKTKNQ
jgi:hypothetical protein